MCAIVTGSTPSHSLPTPFPPPPPNFAHSWPLPLPMSYLFPTGPAQSGDVLVVLLSVAALLPKRPWIVVVIAQQNNVGL